MLPSSHGPVVTACIIGVGNRGSLYANFAIKNPHLLRIVGVASPTEFRRFNLAKRHNISSENIFSNWRELSMRPRIADSVIISNLDSKNYHSALAFIKSGYHVLLENPPSLTLSECLKVVNAAIQHNVIFMVGHPERYSAYNRTMKRMIDSGAIGEVMSIQHMEPIGFHHFRPSFPTVSHGGLKKRESTLSLMSKNIHDIDLISWFMGTRCRRVSSFGSLYHVYKRKNFQIRLSARCRQCPHEQECCVSAQQMYLENSPWSDRSRIASPVYSPIEEIENLVSPYDCKDDASDSEAGDSCDNQIINMEFDGGKTCNFTMVACTESLCERKTRIFGTLGELEADGHVVRHFDFLTRRSEIIRPERDDEHEDDPSSNGDYGVIRFFLECVTVYSTEGRVFCESQDVLENQLYVFAAEHARNTGSVINIDDYRHSSIGDADNLMDLDA
ncbi:streptomycin biosynthesis protein StrI [Basidiobolus meristosporus CBS 931.73]|uniref:Streptomycin biosynthesis protein StrI n=1 Tax=Basidiobolus meristosporus CBS 931.73 TaxID=1314790 RepID=A0A1Y1X6Y2_9FUNG|nr:streptomycin biosynthesis protein StrI [Basidiobolus meristosporus CBS 931.73]|eukprot:ORX81458.1 streptomycin biosynthesis protein StrI [Basidiobolus meristosporus CBS 931.73]